MTDLNFLFNISRDVAMATNFVSYQTCSLGAKVSQDPLDRFSQSLHHMVGIELLMITPFYFFRYLKGRCHGNQFSGKNGAKLPTPIHLSLCQSKREWDIATSMCALTAQMMPLYRVKIS